VHAGGFGQRGMQMGVWARARGGCLGANGRVKYQRGSFTGAQWEPGV
jgi:hypothetical protein